MNAPSLAISRRHHHADDGFTLIELLLVIVILGVLSAIVVFSVKGITDKGDTAACKTSISTVDTAAEADVAQLTTTPIPDASTVTLTQIAPFLHGGVPAKAGGHDVTGATTVATIDGYLAGC